MTLMCASYFSLIKPVRQINGWNFERCRVESKPHLSGQIIPSCQMFEAEEAVPLAGATSAGVIVHNLRQKNGVQCRLRRVQLSATSELTL